MVPLIIAIPGHQMCVSVCLCVSVSAHRQSVCASTCGVCERGVCGVVCAYVCVHMGRVCDVVCVHVMHCVCGQDGCGTCACVACMWCCSHVVCVMRVCMCCVVGSVCACAVCLSVYTCVVCVHIQCVVHVLRVYVSGCVHAHMWGVFRTCTQRMELSHHLLRVCLAPC